MAHDIAIEMVSEVSGSPPEFDLVLDGVDLKIEEGLATAVWLSLFLDARVTAEELDGDSHFGHDLRGWWADAFADQPDNTGSKLWLYARALNTTETRAAIADAIRDALAWMIEDDVAQEVIVTPERYGLSGAAFRVVCVSAEDERYEALWRATLEQ